MPGLAEAVRQFVDDLTPAVQSLGALVPTIRPDKLAGDVALEAYDIAGALVDADGLHTDNECLDMIETFGPRLPSSLLRATPGDIRNASLQIKTNDADTTIMTIPLRGLGTAGTGGANEPSLQRILDLYNLPINVGDSNPGDVYLDDPPVSPNDELVMSTLVKAGTGPVTIEPLASFGVGHATYPTTRFGYYTPGNRFDRNELFTIAGTGAATQTVNPNLNGSTTFDPGSKAFGLYALWPSMQTINGVANVRGTLMSYCHLLSGCSSSSVFHPARARMIGSM